MSILIKGMEMPTSCISCPLNSGEKRPEYGLTIYCPYSDGVISWRDKAFDNGRLASCEIVPVPPHGRLIDADALMKILSKVIDINASIEQRNEATDQERRCLWWFEQQIGIAPTIIEAEEGE